MGLDPFVGQDRKRLDGDPRLVEEQTTGVAQARAGKDHVHFAAALATARQELVDLRCGRPCDRRGK